MLLYEIQKDGYIITTDNAKMDINVIHHYLSEESYWAKGISKEIVQKSVGNSLCFGMFFEGRQIGFARLITDRATFAYLADVFILQEHRGKGLSKWMMEFMHAHPELQNLRRWMLATRDAHTLYKQFGWTGFTEDGCKRLMQKHNPDVYKKQPI